MSQLASEGVSKFGWRNCFQAFAEVLGNLQGQVGTEAH
jgi:hypothetical protein